MGSRCAECGTYSFPKETVYCRNPECAGTEFDEVPLSRRGTIWSLTENRYPPPPPFVAGDPFEPYAIAAVELPDEKMVVLGQVDEAADYESLAVGAEVELVLGTLFEDDEHEHMVWKWRPV